jgi:uncharacterized protein (DUF952 family)
MIFHILRRSEWRSALQQGSYRPASLDAEGFIHCSTIDQSIDTANLLFRGASDLLLLRIYGPLNLDAVVETVEFPCDADGSFQLPTRIRELSVGQTSQRSA